MRPFIVPEGLKPWETRISKVLGRHFPPLGEPMGPLNPAVKARSICELACMEMLDGEPLPGELSRYYQELRERGLCDSHIRQLRSFLWLTVGWLNFEMKRWEWIRLDERDVQEAIELQQQQGLIDAATASDMRAYLLELLSPPA
jgi:hypothetical protein